MEQETKKGLAVSGIPLIYVLLFIGIPIALTVFYSFWIKPSFELKHMFTLEHYATILSEQVYLRVISRSIVLAGTASLFTVILAYPMAYFIAFHGGSYKGLLILLVTVPFWTSYLLRVFSWNLVLGYNGALNSALMYFHIIDAPFNTLMYNTRAVVLVLTHAWAAFAIFPIFVSLSRIDKSLLEAAADLGVGAWGRFFRITLPLSMPGVIGAILLVFMPTIGDYITPSLVGGTEGYMAAELIHTLFIEIGDWPLGAATSLTLMLGATFVLLFLIMIMLMFVRRIK